MNIGRYEVIQELGQGGMAMVYLARDPYIKRQVAIKVLPRQFTFDPQFRTRFQHEAEVIAALEHPAIVPVYDFGEVEDQPFIVMRYMPGGTLADRLTEGPLPIPEIAALFERIGSALDHAHHMGVIHRDIKPGNILFDSQHVSYLSDFGISKIVESTAAITGTGIIGTPAYMSPEQAQGEKKLDGRCDIYSLGVVLFQALTGELPYKADTPMGQAMAHIIEPVPSLLERRPDLPPTFERIIRKTLDKSPDRRYQTASQLSQAIHEGENEPEIPVVTSAKDMAEVQVKTAEQQAPAEAVHTSQPLAGPASLVKSKNARMGLFGVSGFSILTLCLCAGLAGGMASGLLPNPFRGPAAEALPSPRAESSELMLTSEVPVLSSDLSTVTLTVEASTPTLSSSATPALATSFTPTQLHEEHLPYFTASTNMLCREGPGTEYVDRWQLNAGEVVQVLAQWHQDSNWLLVDINVASSVTRTDCCWVGAEGTLNVPLEQIRMIDFLPDRLDCSAVR
ncbi:MAG TPA: serine/threonine-protein kinase [Anaerolineales bacterium]|nr:serine/threonine-protein kinase [Anaerolineales bacterium]